MSGHWFVVFVVALSSSLSLLFDQRHRLARIDIEVIPYCVLPAHGRLVQDLEPPFSLSNYLGILSFLLPPLYAAIFGTVMTGVTRQ